MKHKRLLTAALAASLAVSSLPAALALDTAPIEMDGRTCVPWL